MPIISKIKIQTATRNFERSHLFSIFPKQVFTSNIAKEIAMDEEFTKLLLLELEKNSVVIKIEKNPEGLKYTKRLRWRISNPTYEAYKKLQ